MPNATIVTIAKDIHVPNAATNPLGITTHLSFVDDVAIRWLLELEQHCHYEKDARPHEQQYCQCQVGCKWRQELLSPWKQVIYSIFTVKMVPSRSIKRSKMCATGKSISLSSRQSKVLLGFTIHSNDTKPCLCSGRGFKWEGQTRSGRTMHSHDGLM
jgi:hypothetical protein